RMESRNRRTGKRSRFDGMMFRAASRLTGNAATAAKVVPSSAIDSVSPRAAMSLDPVESSSPRSSRAGSGPTPVWPAKNRDPPTRTRRSRTQSESSPASPGAPMQADRRRQDIWSGARLYPVSATGSCASLLAEQFSAQPAGRDIDNEDGDD